MDRGNGLREFGLQFLNEQFPMLGIGCLSNHVADKERIGQKTGNDFDVEIVVFGKIVKENIVAVVVLDKAVHEIRCRFLHVMYESR